MKPIPRWIHQVLVLGDMLPTSLRLLEMMKQEGMEQRRTAKWNPSRNYKRRTRV